MCDAGTNAEHGEDAAIVKRRMADMAITTCERVGVQDALIIFALRLYVNTDAKQDEVRNNCDRMARSEIADSWRSRAAAYLSLSSHIL